MGLTSCLYKAKDTIHPDDFNKALARTHDLEQSGIPSSQAERQTLDEMIASAKAQLRVATDAKSVTGTPAFKKWFGDSKVVDAGGKPLVVYHGTADSFDSFNTSRGLGAWFAKDPDTAGTYAGIASRYRPEGGDNIVPVYLSLKNPAAGADLDSAFAQAIKEEVPGVQRVARVRKILEGKGFDGVEADGKALIAFNPEQIKSAIGNNGNFDSRKADITQSAPRPMFYSQLERAITSVPDRLAAMGAAQWKLWLDANAGKLGVKKDEIEWSGVKDYLALRGQDKVTSDEIVDYLKEGGVKVEEAVLGDTGLHTAAELEVAETPFGEWAVFESGDDAQLGGSYATRAKAEQALSEMNADLPTKYRQYTVPGGENYRELLITRPGGEKIGSYGQWLAKRLGGTAREAEDHPDYEDDAVHAKFIQEESRAKNSYHSSHWDDHANVLAHLRVDDRTDADGKKVLFINEIQSDWGQEGKKRGFGDVVTKLPDRYQLLDTRGSSLGVFDTPEQAERHRDGMNGGTAPWHKGPIDSSKFTIKTVEVQSTKKGTPLAPFVTDTKSWVALALKRAIIMAAQGGYDKVALINGEQAAGMYDLSKQVDRIDYSKNGDGTYNVSAAKGRDEVASKEDLNPSELEEMIGKDIAQKIVDGAGKPAVELDEVSRWEPESDTYTSKEFDYKKTETRSLSGLDLKVGGEGMKAFYDQIVPQVAREVLKKLGNGRVEEIVFGGSNAENGRYEVVNAAGETLFRTDSRQEADEYKLVDPQAIRIAELNDESPRRNVIVGSQLGFTITPAMREKVQTEGLPLFSAARDKFDEVVNHKAVTLHGETSRVHTPEQLAAMRNVGFQVDEPSIKERFQALTQNLGKRLAQGLVDQFAPIKDLDKDAYMLTRLSKGSAGAFEAFLRGGKLKLDGGAYNFDESQRGGVVDKLLIPLGGEHHDLMRWIAANRAERLTGEGKEHLFTADDIAALKTLEDGQTTFDFTLQHGPRAGQVTRDRSSIYRDSLKTFNDFSKNIMDLAEQSGLINGEARHMWESEFYVPFYRVADDVEGGVRGMGAKGSMVRQEAFKKLKGGKNALNADLLDNTLMNWAHLLDASAKNRAAKATLEAAVKLGVAVEAGPTAIKQMGKDAKTAPVWFMDSGAQRHFIVEDPMLLTAISSLEYAGIRNPVMNAMGAMKHALTVGVTSSPFFKIRNLIRDTVTVIGTSPASLNPVKNVVDGWKLTDPKSDAYFRLLAGGGTIHFGSMMEGSEGKRIQKLVEEGVDEASILKDESSVKAFYNKYVAPAVHAYQESGERGEAINRAALYDQMVKGGMGHAEASLMARDLMDFSMQGSFTSVRFLTQVVPFMNARIQGLAKLGRAAQEDPARMAITLGAVTVASLGLLAAFGDDDDWKRRTEADRNGFWWFKVGGKAFRIPKPFEIGAVATVAERGFELMFDKEMTGSRFRSNVLALLSDNLSMNPVPQLVKPIIDIYANKDSFSGMPIESPSMEKLAPEYRFNDRTSMAARGASTALNTVTGAVGLNSPSPVQLDHMVGAYFGWLGSFIVGASDVIARPLTSQPAQARPDLWKLATGNIVSNLQDAPSRYVAQLYDHAKSIEQAHGTWQMLVKTGKVEDAAEFRTAHPDEMREYGGVEAAKKAESSINTRIREIERSTTMSADEKREALRSLQSQKERAAKSILPR